jgi:hypothetical protein
MSHWVLVDGQLQKSSPETQRWAKRVAKEIPKETSEADAVALAFTEHIDYEEEQ